MISTEQSSISYTGNNSDSTPYPVPFPFVAEEHIKVTAIEEPTGETPGGETELTYGSDYSVSTNVDSEGRITDGEVVTVAPWDGSHTMYIRRETPILQTVDFVEGGQIGAEVLESALDKLVMIEQETRRDAVPE